VRVFVCVWRMGGPVWWLLSTYIGIEEVGELGKIMGSSMTKSELQAAFEEMDLDGDGFVTFTEFEAWFR
jgi:Ca2+-binding EF-hand superfamily protein